MQVANLKYDSLCTTNKHFQTLWVIFLTLCHALGEFLLGQV